MRLILKPGKVIVACESEADRESFAAWRASMSGHVFHFDGGSDKGGALFDLGLRRDACREPINVVFGDGDPMWQPISNLAFTPFILRGRSYASVEGFWQGLKFEDEAGRVRVAALSGPDAKGAAAGLPERATIFFEGEEHAVGGPGHHDLMREACQAKFTQDAGARAALLATGERPLLHRTRRDSRSIPGALMADIWMRIRARLQAHGTLGDGEWLGPAGTFPPLPADGLILFFRRDRARFGFLSHFHPSPIELDGDHWPTVEHWYQCQKSLDPRYRAAIRSCGTPGEAKQLATTTQVPGRIDRSWFRANDVAPRPDWNDIKRDLMRRADTAKYEQNPDLAERLLATGAAPIIEDARGDAFWGTGPDGAGLNWAGRILMEVRDALRSAMGA